MLDAGGVPIPEPRKYNSPDGEAATTQPHRVLIASEEQFKLLKIYNSHFTGSPCWNFDSNQFSQLTNSWNVNIRVIFDLPLATHCYLMDGLTNGEHAKKMIYSRYMQFLKSVSNNRRSALRSLLNITKNTCKSFTGLNLRRILLDTGVKIVPGITSGCSLINYRVYKVPEGEEWRLPLLVSLIEVRDSRWTIQFDEETE